MPKHLTRWEWVAAWLVAGVAVWVIFVPDTISRGIFLTGAASVVAIEVLSALFWRDRRRPEGSVDEMLYDAQHPKTGKSAGDRQ
jgi:hypothetical protein